jgi:hypothetical protein
MLIAVAFGVPLETGLLYNSLEECIAAERAAAQMQVDKFNSITSNGERKHLTESTEE